MAAKLRQPREGTEGLSPSLPVPPALQELLAAVEGVGPEQWLSQQWSLHDLEVSEPTKPTVLSYKPTFLSYKPTVLSYKPTVLSYKPTVLS
jgi:hypothetical protein